MSEPPTVPTDESPPASGTDVVPDPTDSSSAPQVVFGIGLLLAIPLLLFGAWGLVVSSSMGWYAIVYAAEIVGFMVWYRRSARRSASLRTGSFTATVGWLLVAPIALAAISGMCVGFTAGSFTLF